MGAFSDEVMVELESNGIKTGPVPMGALTRQLAMFEGASYPDVEIKLSGGLDGDTLSLLPEITGERVGETFEIVVSGEIVAKQHKIKRDSDGFPQRVLVVSLKVDNMRTLNE